MKIQCDVCEKAEASLFCCADEAALCYACDHRVHHANKVASKHQRFSLINPSSHSHHSPKCDICQERRAFLFCQQDRAVLCRECDLSIHMVNELTKNHIRFLLTGVKLSANSAAACTSSEDSGSASFVSEPSSKKRAGSSMMPGFLSSNGMVNEDANSQLSAEGVGSTSSISEYLIDMLPGWHVDELLEFSAPFGLCKDNEFGTSVTSFASGHSEIWVPGAGQKENPSQLIGFGDAKRTTSINSDQIRRDDVFTVPQISPQYMGKRSRTNW